MSKEKTYDPFEGFKQISEMWEKQINNLLLAADNNEFVRLAKAGFDGHSRYLELLRRNQELMAGLMNIPTKKDVANVTNLSIQTDGKIDTLEEEIWKIQDCLGTLNKEILELYQEMVKMINEIQVEFRKTVQEVSELKKMKDYIQELRKDFVDIKIIQVNLRDAREELVGIKDEIASLKGIMLKENSKGKTKEKELVTTV